MLKRKRDQKVEIVDACLMIKPAAHQINHQKRFASFYKGTRYSPGQVGKALDWPCLVCDPDSISIPNNVLSAKPRGNGTYVLVKFIGEHNSYSWPSPSQFCLITKTDILKILKSPIKSDTRRIAFEEALHIAADIYEAVEFDVAHDKRAKKSSHMRTRSASVLPKTRSTSVSSRTRSTSVAPPKTDTRPRRKSIAPITTEESSQDESPANHNSYIPSEFNLRSTYKRLRRISLSPANVAAALPESLAAPGTPAPILKTSAGLYLPSPEANTKLKLIVNKALSTSGDFSAAVSVASTASSPAIPRTVAKTNLATECDDKDKAIASIQACLDQHGDLWQATATHLYDLGFRDGSWLAWLGKVEMKDFLARTKPASLSYLTRARLGDLFEAGSLVVPVLYERRPLKNVEAEKIAMLLNAELHGLGDIAALGLMELGFETVDFIKLLAARQGQHPFFEQAAALPPLAVYLLATRAIELSNLV